MPGLVRDALARQLEQARSSPPGYRASTEDDGAEAVLWDLLANEKHVGATTTQSPRRGLVRNLCASPDDYETYERSDGGGRVG